MMVLVIGGSGSGKSFYAEKVTVVLSERADASHTVMKKYYLATMQVMDEEGRRKADRHRRLRKGKGFATIEQPTEIHKAADKMGAGGGIALLECISNLTANEMFSGRKPKSETEAAEDIIKGVEFLKEKMFHLVVVSNNVFEDGIAYDETTMEYIRAMGKINRKLADLAEQVVEVAAGIPIVIKQ